MFLSTKQFAMYLSFVLASFITCLYGFRVECCVAFGCWVIQLSRYWREVTLRLVCRYRSKNHTSAVRTSEPVNGHDFWRFRYRRFTGGYSRQLHVYKTTKQCEQGVTQKCLQPTSPRGVQILAHWKTKTHKL